MSDRPGEAPPSTPESSAAVAQTRGAGRPAEPPAAAQADGLSVGYGIGAGVRQASQVKPYERGEGDPLFRPLQIYSLDAAGSRLQGAVARVRVPYEPLRPGPTGSVFEVDAADRALGLDYAPLDLEDPALLIDGGVSPTPSDHRFHLQMVYAVANVVYSTFRQALGRVPAWGFEKRPEADRSRLRLRPFASAEPNAWYRRESGEVEFGYFEAEEPVHGRNMPGGFVFTALSHDIVAHEVTHALLDGLRAHFLVPSRPDVLGFHEGFADLIAYFLHFSYKEVVLAAIEEAGGDIARASLLTELARQFGQTTGSHQALRSAIEEPDEAAGGPALAVYDPQGDPQGEPHALGGVLVNAVFDAFVTVFNRKTRRYLRLAGRGAGGLVPGDLPAALQEVLAEQASALASQFLRMVIRAVDYCPPADLDFGELLRAVVTADHDLVPDDPWGYREAWIDAFARRRIYPRGVPTLSEHSLLWTAPPRRVAVPGLSFSDLKFGGDPGQPAGPEELEEQAHALGSFVTRRASLAGFGLVEPGRDADPPEVQSVRTSSRVGPAGQVIFDLVAEVTQRQVLEGPRGRFEAQGGSTLIVGPDGAIRYVVLSRAAKKDRRRSQGEYIGGAGAEYWEERDGMLRPRTELLRMVHRRGGGS